MEHIILRYCSTIVYVWSCDLSGIPLTKIHPQSVNYLLSVKQWPHNFMLQSDWLMLYYSGSKILPVACQCQTDTSTSQKASGPLMGHSWATSKPYCWLPTVDHCLSAGHATREPPLMAPNSGPLVDHQSTLSATEGGPLVGQ